MILSWGRRLNEQEWESAYAIIFTHISSTLVLGGTHLKNGTLYDENALHKMYIQSATTCVLKTFFFFSLVSHAGNLRVQPPSWNIYNKIKRMRLCGWQRRTWWRRDKYSREEHSWSANRCHPFVRKSFAHCIYRIHALRSSSRYPLLPKIIMSMKFNRSFLKISSTKN